MRLEDRYTVAFCGDCMEDIVIYITGVLTRLGYSCGIADFTHEKRIASYIPIPRPQSIEKHTTYMGTVYLPCDSETVLNEDLFVSDVVICLCDTISDERLAQMDMDKTYLVLNENIYSLRSESAREKFIGCPDGIVIRNYTGQSLGLIKMIGSKYGIRNIYALEYDSVDAVTLFRKGICNNTETYRVSPGMREVIRGLIAEILPGIDDIVVGKAVTKLFGRWR
ncbi:MAG: hypothetical protein K6F44_01730 [Lachnospiraceae bacterium]|nr:hypothetical protein [Lachnospiraceae bacterium]